MDIMESAIFDDLQQQLSQQGSAAAVDRLCSLLRERKEYGQLFYALLLKKRFELGVSPIPTGPSQDIPEALHEPYEEGIRTAAREVGRLLLDEGNIPQAWMYYRMIGETQPVIDALEKYQPGESEDVQPVVEVAYHHGVHPRKGFDLILNRYGICNAITTLTSQDTSVPVEIRDYCLQRLVRALYAELGERLKGDIERREGSIPATNSIRELLAGRDWLFEDGAYHIDMSHLASVVQMSIYLPRGEELGLARELCEYGRRLDRQFQYPGDPPFEDQYHDYAAYMAILAGDDVEKNLAHFRAKVENAGPETGTRPAEVLVNLLLDLKRPAEAVAVARGYLSEKDAQFRICPPLTELCRRASDYDTLATVAREQADPVQFLAALLASDRSTAK
jgi:hypothetical protein